MTIEEMNRIRKERKLSYREIAEGAGVALGTVQKVFGGATASPRYDTLQRLDHFFIRETPAYQRQDSGVNRSFKINRLSDSVQGNYTVQDYLDWPDDERVELIDGVIYNMASPTSIHQIFDLAIGTQVFSQIRKKGGDCVPMIAPVDVQLDSDERTMVQPDFLIVCDRDKIHEKRVVGTPDFIIEILSPSTRMKDAFVKQNKYMNSGVREYWTVDLRDRRVTTYLFSEGRVLQYSLEDIVPIGIYEGEISIDFSDISAYVRDVVGEKWEE
ncbi:MAG: Uma2 family endonuclease [Eubacterium sp.]|nr:Uma2 family endonuclease [Eubacterium sp.]